MLIFKCFRGSYAQGLQTDKSDKDYFEIVIPPAQVILGLEEQKGGQTIEDGIDTRRITLKEFLRQALYGRSTELECLFARIEDMQYIHKDLGTELINNRQKLVSQRLYKGLMGFYANQKHRMFSGNAGRVDEKLGFDPKMAAHGIRAIWQLINLKKTGRLDIYVGDQVAHNDIMNIKAGRVNLENLFKLTEWYEEKLNALSNDNVPPNPDYEWANNFLMGAYYDASADIGYRNSVCVRNRVLQRG